MKRIYFDYAATAPLDPEVFKAMKPYFEEDFGNASSVHYFGQKALAGIDKAREQAANFLSCQTQEVIFTSGATESDNLALEGLIRHFKRKKKRGERKIGFHVITTQIEHPAILETCKHLEEYDVEVTYIKPQADGIIRVEDIKNAVKEETVLISVMYVNNEIGTIQPIQEIGKLIKEINKERKEKITFHTDAVQAAAYLDCKVDDLGVDLLSLSGHKICGPKGVGVLYVRQGVNLISTHYGGHQERGIRPGTYDTAGIVGLGKALELAEKKREKESEEIKKLKDKLVEGVLKVIPDAALNGDKKLRVPNNANLSFKNTEGESMLLMLDMEGIAASTGSACSSGSLEPSHVLKAVNLPYELIHGSLRITLGRYSTEKEVDKFLEVLPPIVKKLRSIAP